MVERQKNNMQEKNGQGCCLFQEEGWSLCGAWAGGGGMGWGWGSWIKRILEKRAELLRLRARSWGPEQGGRAGSEEPGGGALEQERFEHLPD